MHDPDQTYRLLFKNMMSGIAHCRVVDDGVTPGDFVYLEVNEAFTRLTGLRDVVGKRVTEVIPDIRTRDPWLLQAYSEVARTGESQRFERRVEALDLWFAVSVYCPRPGEFVAVFDDTTDARLTAALRESEARYRNLTQDLQVGVLIQGPGAEILLSNPKALELLGLSEAQLLGRSSFDPSWNVIHEDGSAFPGATHPVPVAIATRRAVVDVVMGVYRPTTNNRVWLLVNAHPQLDDAGAVTSVICTFVDITRRKLAEAEAQRTQRQLAVVLESAGDAIAMVDPEYRYTLFNAAYAASFERGFGTRPKPGASLLEALGEGDAALARGLCDRALAGEDFSVLQRVENPALPGAWYEMRFSPIREAGGPVVGVVNVMRDVTQRMQEEQRILLQEAWLRAIYDGSPLGIVRTDVHRTILDANEAFARIVGYGCDELIGTPLGRLSLPEPAAQEAAAGGAAWAGDARGAKLETRWARKDGTPIWVEPHIQLSTQGSDGDRFYFGIVEDVSARKRTQDALQRVLREQEILLDAANAGIVRVVDRRQLWANRWMEETFGYTREEILGQSSRMYYPSQEAFEDFGRVAYPVLATGEEFITEVELVRKDGTRLWVRLNGRQIDPADPSQGVLWVLTDHTAERQATEALRASEARFRQLFEGHAAVMMLIDPESGALIDANPAAARFYGYERAALCQMNIGALNTLSGERVRALTAQISRRGAMHFVVPHRMADGTRRTVEVFASSVEVSERRLNFVIVHDVTDRERARDALERERHRYQKIMDISQDGIHLIALDGTVVDANAAFLSMLGYSREDLGTLNVRDFDVTFPADAIEPALRRTLEAPRRFQTRQRRKDGVELDVEIQAGGVELDGRRYVLSAERDITARVEQERQLVAERERVDALNRTLEARVAHGVAELRTRDQLLVAQNRHAAMGEMIGNIAHQWRQPLNALAMVLANLKDAARFGELDDARLAKAVDDSSALIQRMSATINDFRNFFRPGKEKRSFSALGQVRETLGLLSASFEHSHVAVEIDAPTDLSLFGLPNEYSQVLMNLLTNARQAIDGAGVAQGRVSIRLGTRDGFGCLTVRDNGGGIPEAALMRIWEPYFTTKDGGTGLGLYLSRQIVEQSLGGRIEARTVDGGAEFTVLTPLAPAG